MSFRYFSALPTCLHGRLATRRVQPHRSLTICPRCNYSFAYTPLAENSHSDQVFEGVHDRRTSTGKRTQQHGPSSIHSKTKSQHGKPSSISPSSHTKVATNATFDATSPIKEATEVGDSISHVHPTITVTGTGRTVSQAADEDRASHELHGKPYKQWEDLHDMFLEIRRTRPEEMLNVFEKERTLAREFLGSIAHDQVSKLEFRNKWLALTSKDRLELLPALLVGSLAESASQTLFVLANIASMPFPFRIRMNCLRSVALMYWKVLQQDRGLRKLYQELIDNLRLPNAWPSTKMPTVLLQNLLYWSTAEQCQQIIRDFSERYPDADSSSVIAIIDHYLRIEDREQAFEYFSRLPAHVLSNPDAIITGLRDRLLKLDYVAEGDTGTNFKYLPQLLALGIPPDEALHNIVIETAISNGMSDVAWDLYQYLETGEYKSNPRSHLVLLRDSFQRGDLQRVNQLMTAMHDRDDLIGDRYLMAYSMNIVRNISCYEKLLKPEDARSHIMALYDRAYDREPLCSIGIARPLTSAASLPQPPPTLLAFTIWNCILIRRSEKAVLRLWEWTKHLIANGDKAIVEAAGFDIIYNGFILFYSRKPTTLPRALDVMQYMLSSDQCLPTPRTWSLLLCAFLKHGQTQQAQKILSVMQSRGQKVEIVTEKYGSYVPEGYDLQAIAERIDESLDERKMPEELQDLLGASASLQGDAGPGKPLAKRSW